MKVFPVSQVSEIDQYTINNEPIASIDLMERASMVFYRRFIKLFPTEAVDIIVGPGNNGGDALAIARMLFNENRSVNVFMLVDETSLSVDGRVNYRRLLDLGAHVEVLKDGKQLLELKKDRVIIDGLFGSGINRPLSGLAKEVVNAINSVEIPVVAIDIPSGLFGEDNSSNDNEAIVIADYTITFQFPKLAFFMAENEVFVGQWIVEDIGLHPTVIEETPTQYLYTDKCIAERLLKNRSTFSHKGTYGHALLLAGNYGKMGAAILSSKACLKAGVGLLTSHIPRLGYSIIQTAVPEAMASIDRSDILLSEFPSLDTYTAVGIGPGIGTKPNTQQALYELLTSLNGKPIVLDADALNILSANEEWWNLLPNNAILTPHPGEFDRLAGASNNAYERLQRAICFAKDMNVTIVLKGAYSAVISGKGDCYFNSSGNSGMATAGSGDVLTGIILSLLAQKYEPLDAARLGVYIQGLAADLLLKGSAEEGIIASEIITQLGAAFKCLRHS